VAEPSVARLGTDGEREVPHPQPRVPTFLTVRTGSAPILREEERQAVSSAGEIVRLRVEGQQQRIVLDAVVEVTHQSLEERHASDGLVDGDLAHGRAVYASHVIGRDYDASMHTWVVLLRGINVGGKNVIPMQDLRASFDQMGFADPQTYIQSGNVLIDAPSKPSATGVRRIESGLSEAFGYDARVVVLDRTQMRRVVRDVPSDWDDGNEDVRYNVLFPVEGVRPRDIVTSVSPRSDFEKVHAGAHAVYWSAPFATLTKTAMIKLSGHPVYQQITVRNLNTTRKLLSLMEARI
jgi:uncharacterized protein (DUF1697 family)